jgi:hypothetical protein
MLASLAGLAALAGCASETAPSPQPPDDEATVTTSVQQELALGTAAASITNSCGPFVSERVKFDRAYLATQGRGCNVVDPSTLALEPPLNPDLTYRCCSVRDGNIRTICGGSSIGTPASESGIVFDCANGQSVYTNDGALDRYVRFYDEHGKLRVRQQVFTGVDRWSLKPGGKGSPYVNVFSDYLETVTPDVPGSENATTNLKGAEAVAFSSAGRLLFADYGQITFPSDADPTVQCGQWPAAFEFDTKVGPAVCAALGTTY